MQLVSTATERLLGGRTLISRVPATSHPREDPSEDPSLYILRFSGDLLAAWSAAGINTSSCAVSGFAKTDCGHYGISRLQCAERGCCFGAPSALGPQCYYGATNFTTIASFSVGADEGNDGGREGVGEDEGEAHGHRLSGGILLKHQA